MSIEKDIARIADGVEAILAKLNGVTPVYETLAKAPVAEVKQVVHVVKTEEKPVEKEYSEEEIRTAVREYMNATDKEKAIALLIAHGAKADKPMIKDVTNKTGLMAEIKKCLNTPK
jgi:hypothetical protein